MVRLGDPLQFLMSSISSLSPGKPSKGRKKPKITQANMIILGLVSQVLTYWLISNDDQLCTRLVHLSVIVYVYVYDFKILNQVWDNWATVGKYLAILFFPHPNSLPSNNPGLKWILFVLDKWRQRIVSCDRPCCLVLIHSVYKCRLKRGQSLGMRQKISVLLSIHLYILCQFPFPIPVLQVILEDLVVFSG